MIFLYRKVQQLCHRLYIIITNNVNISAYQSLLSLLQYDSGMPLIQKLTLNGLNKKLFNTDEISGHLTFVTTLLVGCEPYLKKSLHRSIHLFLVQLCKSIWGSQRSVYYTTSIRMKLRDTDRLTTSIQLYFGEEPRLYFAQRKTLNTAAAGK